MGDKLKKAIIEAIKQTLVIANPQSIEKYTIKKIEMLYENEITQKS